MLAKYGKHLNIEAMARREYPISITVNSMQIETLIIDDHYEENHPDMTDETIIELAGMLGGSSYAPDSTDGPYSYFVIDMLPLRGRHYKLIWLLEDGENYIGVVNAFRRK